jgi:hypothetical protein
MLWALLSQTNVADLCLVDRNKSLLKKLRNLCSYSKMFDYPMADVASVFLAVRSFGVHIGTTMRNMVL